MIKLRTLFLLGLVTVIGSQVAKAQDAQYSQFYAAPMYLNPAFVGNQGPQMASAGGNYRNQWPSTDADFITYAAYFDYFFEDFSSGLGVILTRDTEGFTGLSNIQGGLQYAYQLPLTEKLTARAGAHVGAIYKTVDFSSLIFGDMIGPDGGLTGIPTAEPLPNGQNLILLDLALGGLLYSENFWIGGSVWHLNRPNQSLAGGNSRLLMRTSIHAGYRLPLRVGKYLVGENQAGQERSLTITSQFRMQDAFRQLETGMYLNWEPLITGIWYRGIPFPNRAGFINNDALIALIGFSHENFNVGYSFDFTLSNLGLRSGGAHEVSIRYTFFMGDPRKPPLSVRRVPCPRF